jgi:hypothetical protein
MSASIERKLDAIIAHMTAICDGKYGDEKIKFDPKDWSGGSLKGSTMSQCPASFLSIYADTFDYYAAKDEKSGELTEGGVPKVKYSRRTARLARAWSLRAAASDGVMSPKATLAEDDGFGDPAPLDAEDIPF